MSNSWEKLHTRWLLAAMAAPLAQAASNASWLAVLCTGIPCLVVCWCMDKYHIGGAKSKVLGAVQWLWMLLVISEFLHWIMLCWPNHGNYHGGPLILMALAAMGAAKGKENCARMCAILLGSITLTLGVLLVSAMPQIEWNNLSPQWHMQTAYLIVVLLIPTMGIGMGTTKKRGLLLYALLVSVITSGVMSVKWIEAVKAPIMQMSESISFSGVGRRYESITAVGMTIGYYVLVTYLLRVMAKAWDMGRCRDRSIWISAVFCALVFVSGMRLNSRLLALGTLVVWVILPTIEKISKKQEFPIDK